MRAFVVGLLILVACSSSDPPIECPAETVPDALGARCLPTSLAGVATLCADPEAMTTAFEETLVIPANPAGCPWGIDDNLEESQNDVTARVARRGVSVFPSGAVPCSLTLDFAPEGMEQAIDYDDGFFLLFGDVILASSHAALVERMPTEGRFRVFDWSAIAGEQLGFFGVEPYCLGEAEGLGTCAIADPDDAGPITVDLDAELLSELAFRAFEDDELSLTMVAIGDNDADQDCRFSRFAIGVDAPYLL